jgi:hypothetical protein
MRMQTYSGVILVYASSARVFSEQIASHNAKIICMFICMYWGGHTRSACLLVLLELPCERIPRTNACSDDH